MISPSRHPEAARQAVLDAYEIVDTAPEQAFDDIVLLARMVCGTPVAMVTFVDRERQWFKAREGIAATETPRSESVCAIAMRSPEGVYIVRDMLAEPDLPMRHTDAEGRLLRFYAGVPLRSPEGFPLGALCVLDHEPRELLPAQQTGLEALARQAQHLVELGMRGRRQRELLQQRTHVAQLLEHERADLQRRHDDLKREASHDPLTGLLNRNALQKLRGNAEAMRRLEAAGYVFAVVDIDNFKQVNDRHGHLLGDQALRAVAQAVANCIRKGDIAARYGGEEFLVVLPATPLPGAFDVAERIREAAARLPLPFPVTVSIGLAAGDPASDTPEQVFERADQALYRAKAGGRNCVVAAVDEARRF